MFDILNIPGCNAAALFSSSDLVFREDRDFVPVPIGDSLSYIPWGADNMLPYSIIDRFEEDETLGACSDFQAESFCASGLEYVPDGPIDARAIEEFFFENDMPAYWLGVAHDLKMFEFAVSVIILSVDGRKVVNIFRKEAAYCRFAPVEDDRIPYVLYANWRLPVSSPGQVEVIPLLDPRCLLADLREKAARGVRKMAVVTRIPKPDSLYYPIPTYAAIFRSRWYNIKRYIAVAKEAKLRNSAPIKYHIEISNRYWDDLFRAEHITDPAAKQARVADVKLQMVEFLTGAKNSGKALFSNFFTTPDGKESHDIRITKIEDDKEGGDWASDHAEAINMLCFALRVHSNLVGSVPGKSQSNNSGSDKRELYTIAQAIQKPYRDCAFLLHRTIIRFNGWKAHVECPIIQLTTLDSHTDSQTVSLDQ